MSVFLITAENKTKCECVQEREKVKQIEGVAEINVTSLLLPSVIRPKVCGVSNRDRTHVPLLPETNHPAITYVQWQIHGSGVIREIH